MVTLINKKNNVYISLSLFCLCGFLHAIGSLGVAVLFYTDIIMI